MTGIDPREAASALSDIDTIARRVRQSTIYNLASLMLIWWGALILAGNIATDLWPRQGGYIWITVNAVGMAGTFALGAYNGRRMNAHRFDFRMIAAVLMFFALSLIHI